jgi:hypothetical protein
MGAPFRSPFPSQRWLLAALAVCALALAVALAAPARASAAATCAPVVNPYPGTEYEGVDLSHIRAKRIPCPRARKIAKRAHYKALGLTPPPSGVRRFEWRGWRVVGDLRPASDKYTATRGDAQVRWRF